jgi:hypothetical protein
LTYARYDPIAIKITRLRPITQLGTRRESREVLT